MAEVRINTAGELKLFDADDSHSASIAAGTITSNVTAMTLNSSGVDITGSVTANGGLIADNITIDGTEIDLSSGNLTIDVAGDIHLDVGGQVKFDKDGTQYGVIFNSSNDLGIHVTQQDKDFVITGSDGGSSVTALTIDMSEAGHATFNNQITATNGNFGSSVSTQGVLNLSNGGAEQIEFFTGASSGLSQIQAFNRNDSSYDSLEIIALDFAVKISGTEKFKIGSNGSTTITTADNTDTLTLISTDADANIGPNLRLYRNSGSPADSDSLGMIDFEGRNDNSQDVIYGQIETLTTDVSDGAEDGYMNLSVMLAGTLRSRIEMDSGETVINEASQDLDFRVESNGNANMLHISGGNNVVGVGAEGDLGVGLHIKSADSGVSSPGGNADELIIEGSANSGMSILSGTSNVGGIHFGDSDNANIGMIQYLHASDNDMVFSTNGAEAVRFHADGSVKIASTGTATLGKLHIESADTSASVNANRDELVLENSGHCGMTILSGTSSVGGVAFGDSGGNLQGLMQYNHSTDNFEFNTNSSANPLILNDTGDLSTNGETAPDTTAGGLCLNQGANDANILTFKSSDVSHGFTGQFDADTYGVFKKNSSSAGGLQILGMATDDPGVNIFGVADAGSGTVASNTNAYIHIDARKTTGGSVGTIGSEMLCLFQNDGVAKVIFTGAGNIHADTSTGSGTIGVFDEYEDAHLVRAYDLYQSDYAAGLIHSKFDKFISYNAEKLADLELIGRDDDGTPNGFVNVTGFQKLHNGAIWQQYEKHQRLASAFYKLAQKTIGKEEADKLLTEEEIQLLN